MAKTTKFNPFCGDSKGAITVFKSKIKDSYIVCLYPQSGAFPAIVNFGLVTEAIFPTNLSISDVNKFVGLLPMMLNSLSYPTLGLSIGSIVSSQNDLDFPVDYPIGTFVPRVMKPGIVGVSEREARYLLKDFYPYVETSSCACVPRVASDSLSYAPYATLVSTYDGSSELEFELNSSELLLERAILSGKIMFAGLQGPPGTGKSTAMRVIAMRNGFPITEICGKFVDEDQMMGRERLVTCDGNQEVHFIPGALLEAIEYGGWVVFNEANFIPNDILVTLQDLLESRHSYYEKTTTRLIKVHPNFMLAFTWNPGVTQAFRFSNALFNRFGMVLDYKDLSVSEIQSRLAKIYPSADKAFLKKLSGVCGVVNSWSHQNNSNGDCNIRQLKSFYEVIDSTKLSLAEFTLEFRLCIVNPACSCNAFNVERMDAVSSSDEFKDLISELYSLYGCSSLQPVDYDFLGGGSSSSSTMEFDSYSNTEDILSGFTLTLNK